MYKLVILLSWYLIIYLYSVVTKNRISCGIILHDKSKVYIPTCGYLQKLLKIMFVTIPHYANNTSIHIGNEFA